MVSEKALYWISVGVLAIVVSNNLAIRSDAGTQIADRASAFAQRVLDRGREYATYADMAFSRHTKCHTVTSALAETRVKLAQLQSSLACDRANFTRLQTEKSELLALREMRMAKVQIQRQNFKVNVPNVVIEASY